MAAVILLLLGIHILGSSNPSVSPLLTSLHICWSDVHTWSLGWSGWVRQKAPCAWWAPSEPQALQRHSGKMSDPVPAPGLPSPRPPIGLGHQSPSRTCSTLGIPNSVLTPWDDSFIVFLKLMFIFTKVRIVSIKREIKRQNKTKNPNWQSLNLISFGNYYAKHNFIVGKYFKAAVVGKN